MSDLDYSAAETIRQLHDVAAEGGVTLAFAELQPPVMKEFERLGLVELFDAEAFFDSVGDVIRAQGGMPSG